MERETFLRIIDLFSLPMAYADAMADQAGVYSRTHPPAEEHRFGKEETTSDILE